MPNSIACVALNTFGSEEVTKEFDSHFGEVFNSKGVILDVRENGYAIIARLIDKATSQTSKWRTRDYKPALRAWGKPEEWYEGEADAIQPRGGKPYLGPVAVLIGAQDYQRRGRLRGAPQGDQTRNSDWNSDRRLNRTASVHEDLRSERHGLHQVGPLPDGTEFVGGGSSRIFLCSGQGAMWRRAKTPLWRGQSLFFTVKK